MRGLGILRGHSGEGRRKGGPVYILAEPTVGTQNSKVLCGAGHLLTLDLDVIRKLLNVLSCLDSKRSALDPRSDTL